MPLELRQWGISDYLLVSVHFPGAVNSKFINRLSFERPSTHPAMPTYRVMDSDGVIVDGGREPSDLTHEEILQWYRNMLTGMSLSESLISSKLSLTRAS